jgi:hypothetical protein
MDPSEFGHKFWNLLSEFVYIIYFYTSRKKIVDLKNGLKRIFVLEKSNAL